jgi:enamine deaminase RidA (YjgF/YER057c/UK114 family)
VSDALVHPEDRLAELGLELPQPPTAVATFVGTVRTGELVFVSGQGPIENGEFQFVGKLGRDLDVDNGQRSARLAALNALATLRQEIGSLDRVARIVKLLVFVNSTPDFVEQHRVANGASDLIVALFGRERGAHARSAIGVPSLPFGISVEIEMIVQVTPAADSETSDR